MDAPQCTDFGPQGLNKKARREPGFLSWEDLLLLLGSGLGVDGSLQLGTGREFRALGSGDLDGFASLGVAACTGGALADGKGAEAENAEGVTLGEGFGDDFGQAINGAAGSSLGQIALGGESFDEFSLVHEVLSLGGCKKLRLSRDLARSAILLHRNFAGKSGSAGILVLVF